MSKKKNKAQNILTNKPNENEIVQEKVSKPYSKSRKSGESMFSELKLKPNHDNPVKNPIYLPYKAYKRMICYASRYARNDISEKNWKEVYGILIGSIGNNSEVFIKDAIPMVVGDRAGVKYESKQYVDMAQIDESIYERSIQDKKNDFIIGWWHTHPGFKFMFSDVDIQTQLGNQIPNPLAIGLIFNHVELKSNDFYIGFAALRMLKPDLGIFSTYNYVDIKTEFEKEIMVEYVEKVVKDVKKKINKVIMDLKSIDQVLRKRHLAQLQNSYGLIMIPKEEVKVINDPSRIEDDERVLYEWDPEFYKKLYRIPKFREKVENEIVQYEKELQNIKNSNEITIFEKKQRKFIKEVKNLLKPPSEWLNKITREFTKRVEIISPYFEYLDTNERKIIETFEAQSSEYRTILNDLEKKADFNI